MLRRAMTRRTRIGSSAGLVTSPGYVSRGFRLSLVDHLAPPAVRYVVTGAAGFIGSHLLRALLDRGDEAVGWDSFTDYYDPALKEANAQGLPVERVDLETADLDFAGVDGVYHLAGQPGVSSFGGVFPLYVGRNVLATQRLFEAAATTGTRTLFTSSSSI